MDINEIANLYNNLQRLNNTGNLNFNDRSETNKDFLKQINEQQTRLKNISNAVDANESFIKTTESLQNVLDRLDNIQTVYTNPVTGEKEFTNMTIDSIQAERFKTSIQDYIKAYNTAVTNNGSTAASNNFANPEITGNLENIGITRAEDGSLKFDENKFDNAVQTGVTTIDSLKNTISDIKEILGQNQIAARERSRELQQEYKEVIDELKSIQNSFTEEYQRFFENNLNQMLDTVMATFLSSLGIGQNFSEYA